MDGMAPPSPEERIRQAGGTEAPLRPPSRLHPKAFRDCTLDHASAYLVKGILAPGDLGLIIGHPGSGKSLLGPLMAHAVASGRRFFGRRTRRGPVAYLAAEAGADMEVRLVALRQHMGEADGLHLIGTGVDLFDPNSGDLKTLKVELADLRPALIIVDTMAAAFPGMEENEARDMGRAIATLRELGEPSGAAVVAIHHTLKEGNTPRGWSGLNGTADVTIRVEGEGQDVRRVSFGKNRNGSSGPAFDFALELVELGEDADGDPIRRPVAVETHREDAPRPKGRKLNENQEGWLRDLQDMFATLETAALRAPMPKMAATLTLTRTEVRDGFRVRGRFEAEPHAPLTNNDRRRLSDMLNALRDKGKIGLTDDAVWLL